jgi:Tol biopolymer transport system component
LGSVAWSDIGSPVQHGDTVTIADAHLLFSGDYARSGSDLIVSDHLHRVVVLNYFHGDKRPALVSAEGVALDPKVIEALTGHVQYAQAGAAAAARVIGHVVKMTGSASIVRNGVTIDLNNGDVVYQNDVVQTGSGSTLGLVMIDGTTFNLTANARLMMNDLTYDAASTSNSSLFTLVQGAASFVAGQVAKSGDMKVATPVATMGIRGTAVILDISAVDGKVSISVVNQRDGQQHAVEVYNTRGDLIGTVTSNGSVLTLTPTASFEVIAQESNKTVAQVLTEFNAFQQLLSTYDIGKQLVPNTPAPTDGRRGDANPQGTTKFAGTQIIPSDSSVTKFNAEIGSLKGADGGVGTGDLSTLHTTGDATGVTRIEFSSGDIQHQVVEVPTASIPFVVTPSPVSRISSGPGDHFGPVMSADGQFVTYDPDGAIFLFDRQTGTTTTIASPQNGFSYGSPTISADGRFIVYQGSDGTQSFIFIYNNDASDTAHYGQTTQLMAGGQPSISGDGSRIVIEQGGSIGLYDQQGHQLANLTGTALGISGTLWKPAISADGHIIAFWSSKQSTPGGAGQLFTYDLSSATLRSIASTATGAGDSAASFSANGHYVVYQSDAPGGHAEIYLTDLQTGAVIFHTANADASYNPVISPDGHFIIFASDAKLTGDDSNAFADVYVVDVTDPAHPVYKLVSVLDDGTQGNAASNLGATISAGGQFVAFGSSASNFSTGDTNGGGDIFVVDPSAGHSAIILESHNSPALLTANGIIRLTGEHTGVTLGVSDTRITAAFDSDGNIRWSFSEARSDFAALQPGEIAVRNFVITLGSDRSTTEIPVKVSIYDVDQTPVPVADAAPVASPVTLAPGTEDAGYTVTAAALLAGVVDIDGPSLSITGLSVTSGGGTIVDNHDGTFRYSPAANYNGPVVLTYTVSDGTLSASSTAHLDIAPVNDAPVMTKAGFAVSEGGTVVLTSSDIAVSDVDDAGATFTVSGVTHGKFQTTADGIVWTDATTFTTADLAANHVRFVHDGGENAPTFSIGADDGEAVNHLSATVSGVVNFTHVNDAPVLTGATLAVSEGGTVLLDASSLGVSDPDSASFTFTVSGVSHGTFETTTDGIHWSAATTFSSGDLGALHVRFVHDGGEDAPTFSVQADDGAGGLSDVVAGTINFTNVNDAPVVTNATLTVSEGETVVLDASSLGVSDPDSASFTFAVSGVSHGTFETTTDGIHWSAATTFSSADLDALHVRFVHDGGEDAPTFSVQADDGAGGVSNVVAGAINFTNVNDAPVVTNATLTVSEGETVVLDASSLGVSDPDSASFTFTVSGVSHGTFETTTDGIHWSAATTFSSADLDALHVRFAHDGGEDAPTFSVRADDGAGGLSAVVAGTVNFTNVNDAPEITQAHLAVSEGGTVVLETSDIVVNDPDSATFTFTVSDLGHGRFQITADDVTWTDTLTFTSEDLGEKHVRFVHDGGEDAPTFSLQAYDGADDHSVGNVLAGTVDFTNVNDAPAITQAHLAVSEGGTALLEASDIVVNDPDSATFTFIVSNLSHGSFQITADDMTWTDTLTFTTADLAASHVRFVHDGGEDAPTFSLQAYDGADDNSLGNVLAGTVDFTNVNDAPAITSASLTVSEGETVVLSAADIGISDPDSTSFTFTVSNVSHGSFQTLDGGIWTEATSFTSDDLANHHVRFVHDGGEDAPTFSVQADDGAAVNNLSNVFAGTVNFTNVNDAPAVTSASLTVSEGETVVLSASDIGVSDPDSTSFTFTVSNVSHGTFQLKDGGGNWTDATSFTSADLANHHVRFVHDGGEDAPTFSVQADDGAAVNNLSNVFAGTVNFTNVNDAPAITSASLTVSEGETVVLSASDIGVSDPDSTSFTFTVSNVSHGTFQLKDGGIWIDAISFTSDDLANHNVRFIHDGGEDAPTFSIQADDGAGGLSNVLDGTVNFTNINDAPAITSASLTVSEGETVVLSAADIGVSDPDSTSFTFTVSNVSHGTFQLKDGGIWTDAISFTSDDLANHNVRFVHDGGEDAPTFSVQADDGAGGLSNVLDGDISFTNVNDAPAITSATLTVSEGETVVLSAADVGVSDPDSTSFTFTVSNVSHGSFQLKDGGIWTDAISFTSDDLANHNVRFVHDGGEDAPTFSVQADDGAGGLSNVLDGDISFTNVNDAPAITSATLTVSEGETVVLSAADIGVSDPDSTSFTFAVSNVSHGTFQLKDGGIWTDAISFTSDDLANHNVRFVHDGGEDAPTFSVQADDGAGGLSNVLDGDISFTNVNDAPAITSASLTVSEGETVVLTAADIGVSDPDSTSFTFAVSNVSHGSFQTLDGGIWTEATSFTSDDLANHHVRFVHDGGEDAPTFSVQADDGAAVNNLSNLFAGSVDFTNVNDAPSITAQTLASITEDDPDPAGHNVADIFAATFQDVDQGSSLKGIAVIGDDSTAAQGVWQYKSSSGAWEDIGQVDEQNALIFAADTELRFVPASDFNGTPGSLYVVGIDDSHDDDFTTGAVQPGGRYTEDVSVRGGSTPFSDQAVTLGVSVSAVNDAPVASGFATLAAINEDNTNGPGATIASLFSGNFSDSADQQAAASGGSHADTFAGIAISDYTPDTDKGVWQYATTGSNWMALGAASATAAITLSAGVALRFVPAANYNGSATALAAHLIESGGAAIANGAIVNLTTAGTGGSTHVSAGTVALGETINPVNDAPVIEGGPTVTLSLPENTTFVETVVADDVDGDSLTYSILTGFGSPDGSKFSVGSTSGALSFKSAPDFGNPTDSNHNNIYTLQVKVSDGTLFDIQTLHVHVTDVNDNAPVITTSSSQSVAENHTFVTQLSAFDVDSTGERTTFSIADGLDGSFFEIVNGNLQFRNAPDFENPADGNHNNIYSVTVNASDGTNSSSKTISVSVTNVNEAPTLAPDTAAVTYVENGAALALMAGGTITDPDNPSNFDDGSLSVTLNGAQAGDELVIAGIGGVSLSGSSVKVGTTTVGTVSGNHSTHLSIDFNSNATDGRVESVLKALAFDSTSDNPGNADRTATVTFNDGGNDGSGPALGDSSTVTIHVTPVNDAPHAVNDAVITNNAANSTYLVPGWALLANDTDPDSAVLGVSAVSHPSGFSATNPLLLTAAGDVTIHDDGSVGGSFDYTASDGSLTSTAHVTVTLDSGTMSGGSGNDILIGDSSGSTINGNSGDDILIGNAGNDILDGGPGNDVYGFGLADGIDTINHSSGVDTIRIAAGGATLTGLGFAEDTRDNLVIQFNGQQITVTDQFDDSTVGALQFAGGASYAGYDLGGDLYSVSDDSGFTRNGTSGNDILSGDGNANSISGGDGKDLLFGNGGNDTLSGGSGNDLLVGGAGDDLMTGGPGADTFVFAAGSGKDTVTDFIPGQDKISLDYHAFDAASFSSWLTSHATSKNGGHDVLIDLNVNGHPGVDTILLQNVGAVSNLHAADFIVH